MSNIPKDTFPRVELGPVVGGLRWSKPDWAVRENVPCWYGYAHPGVAVAWVDGRARDSLGITAQLEICTSHRENFASCRDAKDWCLVAWADLVRGWLAPNNELSRRPTGGGATKET